jgi:hypothetical protein
MDKIEIKMLLALPEAKANKSLADFLAGQKTLYYVDAIGALRAAFGDVRMTAKERGKYDAQRLLGADYKHSKNFMDQRRTN